MRLLCLLVATLALAGAARAEAPAAHAPRADFAATVPPNPLPPPVTTDHTITLPDRALHFKATAGAVRLSDAESGKPIADIAYTYYARDDGDPAKRPLTIAVNGGPGASSAWLDIGALGPWRLPIDSHDISPSMPTQVVDNADTWLDFTDLLFIDPLGTGYSRTIGKDNEDAEKHFYSVDGDIDGLATVVRKWLAANGRLASPKFIVGESYGGFRAPKLARKLESRDGIAIDGIVMISPVLDFAWFLSDSNPAIYAGHLPSLVAAAKGLDGNDARDKLRAVESYASGPYLVDLFKGVRDDAAIRRMSLTIASFTGMDQKFISRLGGRLDASSVMREKGRDAGKIASRYDANVSGFDPNPYDETSHYEDPVLDALRAPFATAMAEVTADKLGWPINARYEILNMAVNGRWDWSAGHHGEKAEAMGDLSQLLALDRRFHAIVMHGVADQVTPYFTSKLLIDQIPPYGDPDRLKLAVYGGGHMPYLEAPARAAMREDARRLITGEQSAGQR
ncbi:Carboxypeptidase C (Cathepsin A) [Beijerinckiaceae bacterium RH AL1]|nr:Carboxypeptidase C (Cathepsin A) [Beijerinckiaceae bacterium RH CH11]VVB46094.1 Carboxypeptidase C (Cathepsin A) [Beijerinckiaceae bacterium RH AL8]VVC55158.1 Carboxypeptidase C (Cathepsin A) [Beijerinckiaceae bacterium RH AL1]